MGSASRMQRQVASNASARLVKKAWARVGSAKGFSQFLSVKPCQIRLKRLWESLKLNSTMTATGANRMA